MENVSGLADWDRAGRAIHTFQAGRHKLGKNNGVIFSYHYPEATFYVWKTKTQLRCVKE